MASLDVLLVMALEQESMGLFEAAGMTPFYCGVGLVKASYNLTHLMTQQKPKHIINLGTAGSRQHTQGQLVECTSFIQRHPKGFLHPSTKKFKVEALTALPQATCGSSDFIEFEEPSDPCEVFDMEAYALAFVCNQQNIKFNSIKFVTDSSDENIIHDWQKNLQVAAPLLLEIYHEITTKIQSSN